MFSSQWRKWLGVGAVLASLGVAGALGARRVHADAMPAAVLELKFTPTARAQVAIWIEDQAGAYLATVQLTEAVAFRGIGNRPGASEMNSGYRWPYGRREGVLPVWAARRAAAPGAQLWKRVVFQSRIEGLASRTAVDQSPDNYFCLSFTQDKSARAALDAVSCASVFSSDKGRYITASDVAMPYVEPFEMVGAGHNPTEKPLSLYSRYPPRMDVSMCSSGGCADSLDLAQFAADVRSVMPEIDAITVATPPGDAPQSVLFTVPATWPAGSYVAWLEVNVEGDYGASWNATSYPTPTTPANDWDYYAKTYGYPYRGQPSVVFSVPFVLGDTGQNSYSRDTPVGRSSWDMFAASYGTLEPMGDVVDDPQNAPGSGTDRLRRDADGHRFVVNTQVLSQLPDPPPATDGGQVMQGADAGTSNVAGTGGTISAGQAGEAGGQAHAGSSGDGSGASGGRGAASGTAGTGSGAGTTNGMVIENSGGGVNGAVGAIYDLQLSNHQNELRSHTWINLRFRAPHSRWPLHRYELRYGTDPIVDDATFLRNGRQAKNATDATEGATLLMLPTEVPAGQWVAGSVGDLVQQTHYYVAVRAIDKLNQAGPISVAEISTTPRHFATVSPCFVATAAYGTPLASEIGALRRVRDRYLSSEAPGRALVHAYYAVGPTLARFVAAHDTLRGLVRAALSPVVALAKRVP